jgi:hypothetical protein
MSKVKFGTTGKPIEMPTRKMTKAMRKGLHVYEDGSVGRKHKLPMPPGSMGGGRKVK